MSSQIRAKSTTCETCGSTAPPITYKPEAGSAEWWDDPAAYYTCPRCGAIRERCNQEYIERMVESTGGPAAEPQLFPRRPEDL